MSQLPVDSVDSPRHAAGNAEETQRRLQQPERSPIFLGIGAGFRLRKQPLR